MEILRSSPADRAHAALYPLRPAPKIPEYQLIKLIGHGSYGDVWLARDVTGTYRAIKIVWRSRFNDAGPFEREFSGLREIASLSARESHCVSVTHIGKNDEEGFFYYVMELADDTVYGRAVEPAQYTPLTLSTLRAIKGRLPVDQCIPLASGLAQALRSLHLRGLVHRDVKPSNVIFVDRIPKLADIGLLSRSSEAHTFVGTEGFIPPEGPGTPSADVYALGKVIYEVMTGLDRLQFPRLPPAFDSFPDRKRLLELNEVIVRACAPRVAARYADAGELLRDVTALELGQSLRRMNQRKHLLATAGIAFGLVAAGAVTLTVVRNASSDSRPASADGANLVARATQLTDGHFSKHEVAAAEEMALRATALQPDSSKAWAALAYTHACYLLRNWDLSDRRRHTAQEAARRALAIDPEEPLALLASAILLRRQHAYAQSEFVARRGLDAKPDDPRLWRVLSHAVFSQGREDQALTLALQARERFPKDALVLYDLALLFSQAGDFSRFEQNLDASLELRPFESARITKLDLVIFRRGDLDAARQVVDRFTQADYAEDRVVAAGMNLGLLERNPERVHRAAALTASPYISEFMARGGPTSFWRALAFREENKLALERAHWARAEEVLRSRRETRAWIASDQARLAIAIARLGRRDEAMSEISSYAASHAEEPTTEQAVMLGIFYAAVGDAANAAEALRGALNKWGGVSYHTLVLHPWWDDLRGQPEFDRLLEEARTTLP